jgi:hypothetical protein
MSPLYRDTLDYETGVRIVVEFAVRRREVLDYAVILTVEHEGESAIVRSYDGTHGVNEMHRQSPGGGKAAAERFHAGTLGEGNASRDRRGSRQLPRDDRRMARHVKPSESPTAKAMEGAIDHAIERSSPYPERAAFVNADSPHAGREIGDAFDDGYTVVLVSSDGRERLITAKTLAAAS